MEFLTLFIDFILLFTCYTEFAQYSEKHLTKEEFLFTSFNRYYAKIEKLRNGSVYTSNISTENLNQTQISRPTFKNKNIGITLTSYGFENKQLKNTVTEEAQKQRFRRELTTKQVNNKDLNLRIKTVIEQEPNKETRQIIGNLSIKVGRIFRYTIPLHMITSQRVFLGGYSGFRLLTKDKKALYSNAWIIYEKSRNQIVGLPVTGNEGKTSFFAVPLIFNQPSNQFHKIIIDVKEERRKYNHQIVIKLNERVSYLVSNLTHRLLFIKTLADYLQSQKVKIIDEEVWLKSINTKSNEFILVFTQIDKCDQLVSVDLPRLMSKERKPSPNLQRYFRGLFSFNEISIYLAPTCYTPIDKLSKTNTHEYIGPIVLSLVLGVLVSPLVIAFFVRRHVRRKRHQEFNDIILNKEISGKMALNGNREQTITGSQISNVTALNKGHNANISESKLELISREIRQSYYREDKIRSATEINKIRRQYFDEINPIIAENCKKNSKRRMSFHESEKHQRKISFSNRCHINSLNNSDFNNSFNRYQSVPRQLDGISTDRFPSVIKLAADKFNSFITKQNAKNQLQKLSHSISFSSTHNDQHNLSERNTYEFSEIESQHVRRNFHEEKRLKITSHNDLRPKKHEERKTKFNYQKSRSFDDYGGRHKRRRSMPTQRVINNNILNHQGTSSVSLKINKTSLENQETLDTRIIKDNCIYQQGTAYNNVASQERKSIILQTDNDYSKHHKSKSTISHKISDSDSRRTSLHRLRVDCNYGESGEMV